jgi:hypothetical protein
MNKNLKHILSLLCVLVFIFIGIESAPSKGSLTAESKQISHDIKGYNETILILKSSRDLEQIC